MLEIIKKIFKNTESKTIEPNIYERIDEMFDSLDADIITVFIGEDLVPFGVDIINTISEYREELKDLNGFILPPVHVLDKSDLQENQILALVRGKKVIEKYVIPTRKEVKKETIDMMKYIYNRHLDQIFTYQMTEKYVNFVQKNQPWTAWNITSMYSITDIRYVLKNLLEENRSIKDINYVFEKFADCALESGCYSYTSPTRIVKKLARELESCE
ncbi:FHIPEP family type III secretion protein [bacterium]|nr:FHIPEP family type III secretion protein [bacterium]